MSSQEAAVRSKQFCPQLTSARFFAALYVLLYHYHNEIAPLAADGSPSAFRNFIDRGFLGVTFFFVLSGYILSLNYLHKFKSSFAELKPFFLARFARIYPLYLTCVIACIPFAFLDPSRIPHGEEIVKLRSNPVGTGLMYLFGAEAHTPDSIGRLMVVPSWTISTEFFFYLLFPFFAWGVSRLNRFQAKVGILVTSSLTIAYALTFHFAAISRIMFFLPRAFTENLGEFIFQKPISGIHSNWPIFVTGMLLFRAFEGELSEVTSKWLGRLTLGFGIVMSTWYVVQPQDLHRELFLLTKLFELLPISCVVILWLHKGTGIVHKWFGNKTLVFLGEISFALYLVHSPIRLAARFLIAKPLGIQESSPLFYVTAWTVTLLVSWLAWSKVEVPARKAILGLVKRRAQENHQPTTV